MQSFAEFIVFAESSKTVIADFEQRVVRLDALITLRNELPHTPILDVWISDAYRKIEALRPLYAAAQTTKNIDVQQLRVVWDKLQELKNA